MGRLGWRVVPLGFASFALAFEPLRADESPGPAVATARAEFAVRIQHEPTAGAVRRVLDGSFRRLGGAECQRVLDEFNDSVSGRPLRASLKALGHSAQNYLSLVIFYDGRQHPLCGVRENMAVASPGSRVVWICPEQFREKARRNPALAELTLIHEMLHSLGLGENPPSSREITSRVAKRCTR